MITSGNKSAPEMLEAMGRSIFGGADYQARLAEALGVRRDSIRHWLSSRMRLEPDHPIFARLLEIADQRIAEIAKARDELRDFLAQQTEE
jgi:hypothetical protein